MSNAAINNSEIPFGTIIDSRYLIQKVLGQGGLGRTYLAFDTHRFNEPCVLKEFAPLGSGQYDLEKSRELFRREAKILHQISHPQIPQFLACFEGKRRLFLVQEYVKGKTYSKLLQERQQQDRVFSETEVVTWLMNMLPILTYIHQRGIIHRDISPDNIMQPQGEELPVLIDFGVGKLTNLSYQDRGNQLSSDRDHSFVGKMSFVGKIGYAPREQISMGRCSPSSDIYALGVTAIVLLTGKMPTLLLDQYTLEWQWRRYTQTSEDLAEIINKMIEDRPMRRYQAAQEVMADLLALEQNQANILNSELTSLTDSHFYQKISLFPEEKIDKTQQEPVSSIDEETIVDPSFASRANSQSAGTNPQVIEDTVPVDFYSPQARSTFRPHQEQSRSPVKSFSSPPKQVEPPSQPSVKPNNISERENFRESMANPFSGNSQIKGTGLETQFIKRCQQELAYIIGPMANLIVEEVLVQYAPLSPEELVNAVAEQIPDAKGAIEFKRKLWS